MAMTSKLAAGLFAFAVLPFPPVKAASCHDKPVSARGEPARFQWIAKTKARANWRRQVRATTGLGTDWAVWSQASETEERCISSPDGAYCIFTGTPCKP